MKIQHFLDKSSTLVLSNYGYQVGEVDALDFSRRRTPWKMIFVNKLSYCVDILGNGNIPIYNPIGLVFRRFSPIGLKGPEVLWNTKLKTKKILPFSN